MSALSSRNPEEFLSNLPIHQDGTCNGLQHYAAMGRDYDGGAEVNLVNRQKPGDVYTKVCNMVKDNIDKEIKSNILDQKEMELA